MFDYEKRIIKNFDEDGTEEAMKDKKDFLWFTFIETEKVLKLNIQNQNLSEYQKDKIMNLLEKLEFLAGEL